jgi:hypothetical protein
MLEVFVLKSILCVHQNARWNQGKTTPKIYLKRVFFLLKATPRSVLSPHQIKLRI